MTGKDILGEEFERSGMRGYRSEQVDLYLNTVATYVDEINSKNEDLAYKLKILADKIEEYKKDESSIRDALLGAQKLANSVMGEANQKADALTLEARTSAEEMLAQAKSKIEMLTKDSLQRANAEINAAKRECEREQRRLESMKHEVSSFRSSILKQYKSHLDLLTNLPSVAQVEEKPIQEAPKQEYVQETIIEKKAEPEVRDETKNVTSIFDSVPITETKTNPIPKQNFGNTISYTKVVEEVVQTMEEPQLKQEVVNSVEEKPNIETIKSDIIATEDEIKQEIKLQTKEFHSSGRKATIVASEINERGTVSPAIPFNPPKKSGSMAGKFAELDFGKNKE